MKSKPSQALFFIVALLLTITALVYSIQRDRVYEKDYTGDLRNRVVGARLIADGKSPYFYKWKISDSTRYYDPNAFGDSRVSNITATPFFHQLLILIAGLSQATISECWLWAEYLMLLAIVLLVVSFGETGPQKTLVVLAASVFLFSDAWKSHVFAGQMYLVIAFFASLFMYLFKRAEGNLSYLACGMVAAALVFTRPNFIVFFLPLFLLRPFLKTKSVMMLLLPGIVGLLLIVTNPFQRQLWKDFFSAVSVHTKIHQGEKVETIPYDPDPGYRQWEGIDMKTASTIKPGMSLYPRSENGNFFVLVKLFLHKKTGSAASMAIALLLVFSLLFVFYKTARSKLSGGVDLNALFCLGFCLYMITDLFSPVYRRQYYTVQWIPAVLLLLATFKWNKNFLLIVFLWAGLALNVFQVPFVKMEHTIGEYLILAVLIVYSFVYFNRKSVEA